MRALENYGHHAEVVLAGAGQKRALLKTLKFPQQINPFNSTPDRGDCYGPMILSMLEYTSLTTGIAVRAESATVLWSSVKAPSTATAGGAVPRGDDDEVPAFTFTQRLGGVVFTITSRTNGTFVGTRNGALVFECSGNTRVVTGLGGAVLAVVGASATVQAVALRLPGTAQPLLLTVAPNEEWAIHGNTPSLTRKVAFTLPHGVTPTNCTQGPSHDSCVVPPAL